MVAAYFDSVAARFPRKKHGFQSGRSNPNVRQVVRREEEGRGERRLGEGSWCACVVEGGGERFKKGSRERGTRVRGSISRVTTNSKQETLKGRRNWK